MGFFDFFKGKKALQMGKTIMKQQMFMGGQTYSLYNTDYRNAIQNGYEKNVDVYAIISDIASRAVEVPIELYSVSRTDIKKVERYKAIMTRPTDRSLLEAKNLRAKAIREVEQSTMLELLRKPNSYQTTKDFFESIFSWYLLLGDVGVYAEMNPLNEKEVLNLHVIAANDYDIVTDTFRS